MLTSEIKEMCERALMSREVPNGITIGYILRRVIPCLARLEAYEDTGLTPEEVAELADRVKRFEAEREGCVLVSRAVISNGTIEIDLKEKIHRLTAENAALRKQADDLVNDRNLAEINMRGVEVALDALRQEAREVARDIIRKTKNNDDSAGILLDHVEYWCKMAGRDAE